ncbi:MAG: CIA30 family protein [Candidatus Viridilinea halotolerans]|uniref:CIA30 family protein n=1 Tax=Candidatus Viridilinea halotolerans TaxID=2491704 RepID=A0A426UC12_9CHLR|nr:MAG: CIA30 family protein [Candidatus Viridilinea halotolerans]
MNDYILSDLSQPTAPAAWHGFSDQVMGGVSQEQVTVETIAERRAIRLRGMVRLEHSGGFVQIALPLGAAGQPLAAHGYCGIRLLVWGNGEEYRVHLRTSDCLRPQQFYWQPFVAHPTWQQVTLPFDAFTAKWLAAPLNTLQLTRLGVVAYGRPFAADVAVTQVALYGA